MLVFLRSGRRTSRKIAAVPVHLCTNESHPRVEGEQSNLLDISVLFLALCFRRVVVARRRPPRVADVRVAPATIR